MHPQARAKAAYILSAADPTAAYHEILSGKYDSQPLPAFKDNGQLERQSKAVDRLGVNSTPAYWIDGHYVGGSDLRLMQQLLELPLTTAGKQAQPKK
jgi:thiol:disulfide interchange protein DsbC